MEHASCALWGVLVTLSYVAVWYVLLLPWHVFRSASSPAQTMPEILLMYSIDF